MRMPKKTKEPVEPVVAPEAAKEFLEEQAGENAVRQISLKLSAELLNRCDEAARSIYISRSAYIKTALREKLERDTGQGKRSRS